MKKTILISITALALAGLLFAQVTPAPKPNPNVKVLPGPNDNPNLKPRPMDLGPGPEMCRELQLSEAQQTKLEELRVSHRKAMNTLRAEIENLHMDIRQAIRKDDFTGAKRLTQNLFAKKNTMANARLDHLQAVLKELDAKQKEMFRDMHTRQGHCGPGMGKGHVQMRDKEGGECIQHGQKSGMPGKGCGSMMGQDCGGCGDHGQKTGHPGNMQGTGEGKQLHQGPGLGHQHQEDCPNAQSKDLPPNPPTNKPKTEQPK